MLYLALTPEEMTTNLEIHLRATGREDMKRYTVPCALPVGRAASHKMDRTVMGILLDYLG